MSDEKKPTAILLCLHGLNEHAGIFDQMREIFRSQGIQVEAITHAGFGNTPERGEWVGFERLMVDIYAEIQRIKVTFPDTPLFLLGHSLGGALALMTLQHYEDKIDIAGLCLLAPAVARKEDHAFGVYGLTKLLNRLCPRLKLPVKPFQYLACDKAETLRARSRDPLIIHWPRVAIIHGVVEAMAKAFIALPAIHCPILLLRGDKERVVPKKGLDAFELALNEIAPSKDIQVEHIPNGYHFLIRDKVGPQVIALIQSWVKKRI